MSGNIDEKEYREAAKNLQKEFIDLAMKAQNTNELSKVSKQCFDKEEAFVDAWLEKAQNKNLHIKGGLYFKNYWNKKTKVLNNEYKGF